VIVVDDVFTTGTTIRQCAETLYKAGAVEILGATLASGRGHF
ncbi:MAG: ComF family protein, partial [Peptococcaceae bacterium]|nr:ComF family protein [Peptococcaceae bacterium]